MDTPFLTILVADVGASAALFARLGDDAADAVLRRQFGELSALAEEEGGRSVAGASDAVVAAFPSAAAAVRSAVAMQRWAEAAEEALRIGLDAGEPVLDAGEPRGTPVITATALCGIARHGEILVSDVVRAVAAPRVSEQLLQLGPRRLQGLPDPVAVSRVLWRDEDAAEIARPEEPATPEITVVIADDQELLRAGFRVILDAERDITVVGEAGDGRSAVDLVLRRRPDVVLMDIRMPEMDGLDAAERLLAEPGLETAVVVLTTFDASDYVYRALRIGASGFLLKDTPSDRLLDAVRVAAAGDALIAPSITRRLVEQFAAAHPVPRDVPAIAELTARELEVLRHIARGLSNAEIAGELVLAENTVKTHVARVLSKLDLRDRVQAVVLAYECGLVRAATPTPPGGSSPTPDTGPNG